MVCRAAEVAGLAGRWAESMSGAPFSCAPLEDHTGPDAGDRLVVAMAAGAADGAEVMLPLLRASTRHSFTIGQRRLGRVAARSLVVANPWMAEGHAPADIAALLARALAAEGVDLIETGEIPHDSVLRAALEQLRWPLAAVRIGRKESVRWLIDLPDDYEAFMKSLPGKERRNLTWRLRKVTTDFDMRIETFTTEEGLDRFLEEGERISRMTYQWNVGQQLRNDAETRAAFRKLAAEGRLRCHLLSLDGVPRAFSRGVMLGDMFHYDTPGYDPAFASYSIGTVILLHNLQDLIENTACRVFDFGTGGDWTGFKSRFGNRHYLCNSHYVVDLRRPRGLAILAGENLLSQAKNLADRVLGSAAVKDRVRRWLRRYGDGGGKAA